MVYFRLRYDLKFLMINCFIRRFSGTINNTTIFANAKLTLKSYGKLQILSYERQTVSTVTETQ